MIIDWKIYKFFAPIVIHKPIILEIKIAQKQLNQKNVFYTFVNVIIVVKNSEVTKRIKDFVVENTIMNFYVINKCQ